MEICNEDLLQTAYWTVLYRNPCFSNYYRTEDDNEDWIDY